MKPSSFSVSPQGNNDNHMRNLFQSNEAGAKQLSANSNEPPRIEIGGPCELPRKSTGLAMRAGNPEGKMHGYLPDAPASSHKRTKFTLPFDFCWSAVTSTPGRDTLIPD